MAHSYRQSITIQ